MTEKEKLGKYIRELRESTSSFEYSKSKISQQELADSVFGLSKNTLLNIEKGRGNPSLDTLVSLAKALQKKKVSVFDIKIDVHKYIVENGLE